MITTNTDENSYYLTLLQHTLVKEVEKEILNDIMPDIKKRINALAVEAVAKWSTEIRMAEQPPMMNGYNKIVQIQVNFVEKIVRTLEVENPISITVKN